MIGASKLKSRPMCLQRSIASVPPLAIQNRHFDDLQLVAKQAEGRSGVFCCFRPYFVTAYCTPS